MNNYFEFDSTPGEAIVSGSEQDFILIIAFVASVCVELSDKIYINLTESGGEAVCSISVDRLDLESQNLILNLYKDNHAAFDSETSDRKLWFHLIKLLADANLWDVATTRDDDGKIRFILSAPLTSPFDAIAFRDPTDEFFHKVVYLFFAEKQ